MITTDREPKRLVDGRYEVLGVLGAGGSSIVYLARHHALQRDVAIKLMRPEVFRSSRELDRHQREARIVASLNHPNIVTLHDVGKLSDGRPYMVMEVVEGKSLNRFVSEDVRMPIDLCVALFEQVTRALGHAHRHGVIHRDIKPGNILLRERSTGYPTAKVADFGVASWVPADGAHRGDFIGTPMYMSPEQALGKPVSPASDLYSLGVVMYRLLTGTKPFEGDTPLEVAMAHVSEVLPDIRTRRADVPADLAAVIMRCVEKDPGDRYPSAGALLVDLMEVQVSQQPVPPALHSQETMDGPVHVTRPPRRWRWRDRALVAAATGGVLGIGAILGWVLRAIS